MQKLFSVGFRMDLYMKWRKSEITLASDLVSRRSRFSSSCPCSIKMFINYNMDCPFYTALSPPHGRGLFSNQYFPVGTVLFRVSDLKGNVTGFGRWVNYSRKGNIILHKGKDGYYAIAAGPIYQGREILVGY